MKWSLDSRSISRILLNIKKSAAKNGYKIGHFMIHALMAWRVIDNDLAAKLTQLYKLRTASTHLRKLTNVEAKAERALRLYSDYIPKWLLPSLALSPSRYSGDLARFPSSVTKRLFCFETACPG
jgi:hypothetical protein